MNNLELGPTEIIFILFIILMIFGPDKLPEFARRLGFYYRKLNEYRKMLDEEFRKAMLETEIKDQLGSSKKEEIDEDLKAIAKELGIDTSGKTKRELVKDIRMEFLKRSKTESE